MNPIDKRKVSKLIDQVRESMGNLKIFTDLNKQEFLQNFKNTGAAKYYILIGIEAMIDISNHIVARMKLGTPEDYADVFKIVNEIELFTEKLEKDLINMARYRNKLVHLYWKIDDSELYDSLKDNIKTFKQFELSIQKYLKEQE